ncbi:MAG: hypothetical protein WKF94_14670 [Solirubrobacteraceae bacterium]
MSNRQTLKSDDGSRKRRGGAMDALPGSLKWTATPRAIFTHGAQIGLDAESRLVVLAMWARKWFADSPISVTPATIAEETGLSEKTVRRRLDDLRERKLVRVAKRDPGSRGRIREWDLNPLWERLGSALDSSSARLEAADDSGQTVQWDGPADAPEGPSGQPMGQTDPHGSVPESNEGEGSGTTRNPEKEGKDESDHLLRSAQILRQKAEEPGTYPSQTIRLIAEARKLEKEARAEQGMAAMERLMGRPPTREAAIDSSATVILGPGS